MNILLLEVLAWIKQIIKVPVTWKHMQYVVIVCKVNAIVFNTNMNTNNIIVVLLLKWKVFILNIIVDSRCSVQRKRFIYKTGLNFECFIVEQCTVRMKMRRTIITKVHRPSWLIIKHLNDKPCIIHKQQKKIWHIYFHSDMPIQTELIKICWTTLSG